MTETHIAHFFLSRLKDYSVVGLFRQQYGKLTLMIIILGRIIQNIYLNLIYYSI